MVPMPAMESRIHAPSRYDPSVMHWAAAAVVSTMRPPRVSWMASSSPPVDCSRDCTCSMESTCCPSMCVMMSPVRRPHARAGDSAPSSVATSVSPTTMTPRENSLMPTVRPTGITVRSGSVLLKPKHAAAVGRRSENAVPASVHTSARLSTAAVSQIHHGFASFCSIIFLPSLSCSARLAAHSYYVSNHAVIFHQSCTRLVFSAAVPRGSGSFRGFPQHKFL